MASLAVLTDSGKKWRPDGFGYELWGCRMGIRFPAVKIRDFADRWHELENSENPFAVVVMTHLKTQETRHDQSGRKHWKFFLVKKLYERGYPKEDVVRLFHFIDWLMMLPEYLEQEFWQDVSRYEEEKKMPYVSSVERIGFRRGVLEGRQEGIQVGRHEGMLEGLLEAIEMGLDLKFGPEGIRLLPAIRKIRDMERLKMIKNLVRNTDDLSEVQECINI